LYTGVPVDCIGRQLGLRVLASSPKNTIATLGQGWEHHSRKETKVTKAKADH